MLEVVSSILTSSTIMNHPVIISSEGVIGKNESSFSFMLDQMKNWKLRSPVYYMTKEDYDDIVKFGLEMNDI